MINKIYNYFWITFYLKSSTLPIVVNKTLSGNCFPVAKLISMLWYAKFPTRGLVEERAVSSWWVDKAKERGATWQ